MPLMVLTRLLDLVGDLGLDLLGRGAGRRVTTDHREVDLGKAIDAELRVAGDAEHTMTRISTVANTGRLTLTLAKACMACAP